MFRHCCETYAQTKASRSCQVPALSFPEAQTAAIRKRQPVTPPGGPAPGRVPKAGTAAAGATYLGQLRNSSLAKRLAKVSASSGLAKQNATKSLSSRRREYVSCAADKAAAAVNITSLFLRPRTFPAGSTTWCGQLRLRSARVIPPCGGSSPYRHQFVGGHLESRRGLVDRSGLVGGLYGA
jgi:hypothetical protein